MRNFYEILEIDKNATFSEIKKAYSKLLRKYPPEKEAEKYKEIREAYDTLKDEKSRKNYDTYFSYGDEIKRLEESANENIEDENYSQAEKDLKKILIIAENIAHIREMLGEVLRLQEKYSESLLQFKKLTEEYPENADYYIKLGKVYKDKNQYNDAEREFLKAYNLDFSNPSAINSIVYLYINQNNIDKAIKFLEKDISRDNSLDFDDFYSLTQLIECYVHKNDKNGVQKIVRDIRKIIPQDEESKKYVSWKLAKLGSQIHEIELYDLASEVLTLSADLDPTNPDIKNILNLANLYSSMSDLINDESVYKPLKGPIFFYMHGTEENQKHRTENIEYIKELLDSSDLNILKQMEESLRKIKSKYYSLYLERKEIYVAIESDLNRQLPFIKQLNRMENDSRITNGLKHCIYALVEENDGEFKKGITRLDNEYKDDIKNSIDYIQTNYSKIYGKFTPFFNNLKKTINNSNSSSNSSGGCYVATAVYGSYDCPEVWTLRRFRDDILSKTVYGRMFIKVYYAVSPALVKLFGETTWFKSIWRTSLDKMVANLKEKGIKDTPYND